MAKDAGEDARERGDPAVPFVHDDALAEHLEAEVSRIEAGGRAPLAGLSDDELVEALSADVAATGDTLDAITKLQAVLSARARARAGDLASASGWIPPQAFLDGPAVPVPEWEWIPQAPLSAPTDHGGPAAEGAGFAPVGAEAEAGMFDADAGRSDAIDLDAIDADESDASVVDEVEPSDGSDDVLTPRATARLAENARVLGDTGAREPILRIEQAGLEPTPPEFRAARSVRLFWLWFAATSSLATIAVGAALVGAGLAMSQVIVATIGGLVLSILPLSIGTLGGRLSGQPTMAVSRAVFGTVGNVVPAAVAVASRLFWAVAVLWFAGTAIGIAVAHVGWPGGRLPATIAGASLVLVLAGGVAFVGYGLLARVQLVVTICSAVLLAGVIAVSVPRLDAGRLASWASGAATGSAARPGGWAALIGGGVLVFSFVGLAWSNSVSDVARHQRSDSSAAASMTWASSGAVLAPLVLICFGAAVAASAPALGARLASDPVGALIALGIPGWFALPLVLSIVLGLAAALVLNLYSMSFALQATGLGVRRSSGVFVAVGLTGAGCAALIAGAAGFHSVYLALPITVAVPVAAWTGSFAIDLVLRRRRFHGPSLLNRGGVYPDWRWGNLGALVVGSIAGFGMVRSSVPWLAWEGYLLGPFGLTSSAAADWGVLVSLAVGAAAPLVFGVREIRRQERSNK